MTIFDRYLIRLFLKTLLICFISLAGLYVVIHAFSNLDELSGIAEKIGWSGVFAEFYLPRFADLYDKSAGILILVAALFSISLLQRRREMTAVEAAGVTKARLLRSVLFLSVVFIAIAGVNRELIIPRLQHKLVQSPQSWGETGIVEFSSYRDPTSGVVIRGKQLKIEEGKIDEIVVRLPLGPEVNLPPVEAKWGMIKKAGQWNPDGVFLHQVANLRVIDQQLAQGPIENTQGQSLIETAQTQPWVGAGQCFIRCQIDSQQLAYGDQLMNYQSTREMIAKLNHPKRSRVRAQQVAVHCRLVKPLLDMSLLLLGLPIVIAGRERNVFVSAGLCFWVIAGVQLTTITCRFLGTSNLIEPTALAAWLPVMIFVPLASVAVKKLKH